MRIRATVTVNVDPAEWMLAAGLLESIEVRKDVIAYIRGSLVDAPMFCEDTHAKVIVK